MKTEIKVIVSLERGNNVVQVVDDVIQYEELLEGEILVDLGNYNDFLKPTWDGEKWTEGASQQELDARAQDVANQPKPLEQQIEMVKEELTQAQDTTIMALDVAASIYEASLKTEEKALTALDVAASLYEELLTIKMQLEGGN